jgi:hypothetical protein
MPMDTGVLYGEMAGSWLLHLAIPVGVYSGLSTLLGGAGSSTIYIVLGISIAISIMVQLGFLTFLQALSCGGVTNVWGIFGGTIISVGITALFLALPTAIEGLRLTISQIFIEHLPIFTAHQYAEYKQLIDTAVAAVTREGADNSTAIAEAKKSVKKLGVTPEEYEQQTLRETVAAMSYMSAFSGAFGIGVGSFYAGKCNPRVKGD